MVFTCCKSFLLMKKTQPNSADLTRWKPFSTTHVHKHCSINRTPMSEHFFTGSHNYVESFWWKLIFILIVMDLNAFYGIQYLHICFGLKNYLDERHFLFLFFYTNEVRKKKKTVSLQLWKWLNGLIKPSQYHHTAWNCPNI